MFLENTVDKSRGRGWIEVISGSMFSGKTEELIRRLKRAKIARQKVEIFKPRIEVRYSVEEVVSHDDNSIHSTPVDSAANISCWPVKWRWLVLMRPSFSMTDWWVFATSWLIQESGLSLPGWTWTICGKPFGPMPKLLSIAEYVTKVHAICVRCGSLANYTHRLSVDDRLIVLGETDIYEPLCRVCYYKAKSGS